MGIAVGLKILLLAIFFVTSGGVFFPHKFRKNRLLIFVTGLISIIGTTYLGIDLYDDLVSDARSAATAPNKDPEFHEFSDLVSNISSKVGGSGPYLPWEKLQQLHPYFHWSDQEISSDSLTDNYVFRGETYLRIDGVPDVNRTTGKPQPWQVSAYGLNHHTASGMAFTRGHVDAENLFDELKEGLRRSFQSSGYQIQEFNECKLMQSIDAYYIVRSDKKILFSLSFDGGSSGLVPTISLYFPHLKTIGKTEKEIFNDIRIMCI